MPFRWSGVDGFYYLRSGKRPADLQRAWNALLDKADFVTLIAHAGISCVDDDRFAALDRILERVATMDVVTAGQIARSLPSQ